MLAGKMRITTIIKFIVVLLILAGIAYISLGIFQIDPGIPMLRSSYYSLLDTFNELPVMQFIIVASMVAILVFGLLIYRNQHKWRIYREFRHIDSATLDSDMQACTTFYSMAYAYRCKHGSKKFRKNIIEHYHFFYESHNHALNWINDIVTQTEPEIPSCNFITSAIRSGRIGEIYSHFNYGARGLSGKNIKPDTPLLAHAKSDSIEFWSRYASKPVCIISKNDLKLQRAGKQKDNLTGILIARSIDNTPVKIELRFPATKYKNKTSQHHEKYALQNYQHFEAWLNNVSKAKHTEHFSNYGISVEHGIDVGYGIPARGLSESKKYTPLIRQLKILEGIKIDAVFASDDLPFTKQELTLEAIVLCSGLGIVTITQNNFTGSITYSGDSRWLALEGGRSHTFANTCQQALTAKISVANLLSSHDLISWPIHTLVVFTQSGVELNQITGKKPIQCDVITLAELGRWFTQKAIYPEIRFTKEDYNRFSLLFNHKTGKYLKPIASEA